jgi:ribulose-bisphosphate carboxylase small chain
MTITQGAFSYLPPLTDDEIAAQIDRGLRLGWAVSIQFTDRPEPRRHYWRLWGTPRFDDVDAAAAVAEIGRCRAAFPDHYVKVELLDASVGRQVVALGFLVHRPDDHA